MKCAAFLRGINVGGHQIKMESLREVFESLGFSSVKTILASGNVVFETSEKDISALTSKIEKFLHKKYGYEISTTLRSLSDLQKFIDTEPFKGILVTKDIRLYVTFFAKYSNKNTLPIPYVSPDEDYTILTVTKTEICSVLDLSRGKGTVDAMAVLEKEFGKKVTTRNWNTVLKVVKS